MPTCKTCKTLFSGAYRDKYCSLWCQLLLKTNVREFDFCWDWLGAKTKSGYGLISVKDEAGIKNVYAHRLSFSLFHKQVTQFVLHKCDRPQCVNPYHLYEGDHLANMADMAMKKRAAWSNKKMPSEIRNKIKLSRAGWKPSESHLKKLQEGRIAALKNPEYVKTVYAYMRGDNNPMRRNKR